MKKILFIVIALCTIACTDEGGARKALLDAGYKPIQIGGYGWFDGGKEDMYVTRFKAYSPNDSIRVVTGSVCRGLFKGNTIRLD